MIILHSLWPTNAWDWTVIHQKYFHAAHQQVRLAKKRMHFWILAGKRETVESASISGQEQDKSESKRARVTGTSKMSDFCIMAQVLQPWQHGQMEEKSVVGVFWPFGFSNSLKILRMYSVTCKWPSITSHTDDYTRQLLHILPQTRKKNQPGLVLWSLTWPHVAVLQLFLCDCFNMLWILRRFWK